ncbi:MAG: Bacteriophage CI repressor helix-turn-helix domain protein [Syntrophaceae bacterium PtaU1.Bin231]|nr:MAG: Bacteriophage CI repressor helix-turn-helix domain protein [Syntrophaceae bacterium PtaU1.Bin231]
MTLLADRLLIDFNTTWERIRQVTEWKSYVECANYLNIKPGTFAGAKRRGAIPFEWLMEISEGCGVSLDWLIRGKGKRWREGFAIGEAIKRRREFLKVSVDDLAARLGVAAEVIRSWEEDRSRPQESQTESLARILGIPQRVFRVKDAEVFTVASGLSSGEGGPLQPLGPHDPTGPPPPGDSGQGRAVAEFKISEDLTLAARVLEPGAPYSTTALRLDIRSFAKPVTAEARIARIEEDQKKLNDLLTQVRDENKALRAELDRLKTSSCEVPGNLPRKDVQEA